MDRACSDSPKEFRLDKKSYLEFVEFYSTAPVGVIEDDMLRVKIEFGDGSFIYIDHFGGIEWSGQTTRKFDESDLNTVDRLLQSLAGMDR